MTEDVRKLLGGYATGTLSPDERQLLFEAALTDDDLFAALSDEHVLKELLDDSTVRALLLRAAEEPRFSVVAAFREWFESPKSKALVATGAVLLAVIGFKELRPKAEVPAQIAELREQVKAPAEAPKAEPPVVKPALRRSRPKPPEKVEADQPASQAQYAQIPSAPAAGAVGGAAVAPEALIASRREMRMADAAGPAAAEVSSSPLRYELLLKTADEEYRPVAGNHEFVAGDVIRVRVTSSRAGAVAISAANQATVVVPVRANEPATLPVSGGITIAPGADKLVLGFAVLGADLTSASRNFTMSEEAKAKQSSAPSLTIEIPIRQRK